MMLRTHRVVYDGGFKAHTRNSIDRNMALEAAAIRAELKIDQGKPEEIPEYIRNMKGTLRGKLP